MADSGSSLAAALAWPNVMPREEAMPIIVAAARERLRLSRDDDGLWPAELVEVVMNALRERWAGPLQELYLPQGVGLVLAAGASAVLAALDLYAKEAK